MQWASCCYAAAWRWPLGMIITKGRRENLWSAYRIRILFIAWNQGSIIFLSFFPLISPLLFILKWKKRIKFLRCDFLSEKWNIIKTDKRKKERNFVILCCHLMQIHWREWQWFWAWQICFNFKYWKISNLCNVTVAAIAFWSSTKRDGGKDFFCCFLLCTST